MKLIILALPSCRHGRTGPQWEPGFTSPEPGIEDGELPGGEISNSPGRLDTVIFTGR